MRTTALPAVVLGLACLAAPASDPGGAKRGPSTPDFRRDVAPMLEAKCLRCHGAKERKGGLDLRTPAAMLKGGNSGPAIVPGKADKSLLVELLHFNEMPPKKEQPRVSKEELEVVKRWIDAGAPAVNKESDKP